MGTLANSLNTDVPEQARSARKDAHDGHDGNAPDLDDPVATVGVVTLDRGEIEAIEREFGSGRSHAREWSIDLLSTPAGGSGISSTAQPATQTSPVAPSFVKPDAN